MLKLHEVQQSLEALGIYDELEKAKWYGGGSVPASSTPGGPSTWGAIGGILSDQTDLQAALDAKENAIVPGTTLQYFRGDKTWATLDTGVVPENGNLYYTQARFNTAFAAKSTTDLAEGTNLYYTAARFNTAFSSKTTSDLTEGSNLYYTDERVDDRINSLLVEGAGIDLTYDDTANTLTIASTLTQYTDELAQDAIGAMIDTTLVYVDATPLLTRAAITGDISIPQASNTSTLATVNSDVGSFGSATQVGVFTVNAKGLITAASNTSIQIAESQVTGLVSDLAAKQPLDSTLTALAAYNTDGILTQTAADTFVGRTITGTSNRITITDGNGVAGNPTIDISSSYVGQNTITTLGTITTGVWTGTAIAAANGGTGQTSYAVGDLIYASGATTLAKLADVATGNALISGGVGVAPSWGKIGLTTHVSGILPSANGGTGVNNAGTITNASNTTITGGGTIALGGFTLTVPATGTAVLGTGGNTRVALWSGTNTLNSSTSLIFDGTNLGVGGTPTYTLDVFTLDTATSGVRVGNPASYVNIANPGSVSNSILITGRGLNFTTDNATISSAYQPGLGIGIAVNRATPGLAIRNDGGPSLLIESGAVGIGVSSPNTSAVVHLNKSVSGNTSMFITNDSTGSGALASMRVGLIPGNFFAKYFSINILGTNFGASGTISPENGLLELSSGGDLVISQLSATKDIILATGASRTEALRLSNAGNLSFIGTIKERARSTPMGEWINVAYNAGNYGAAGGGSWTVASGDQIAYQYMLVGKTCFLTITLNNTSVSGTVSSITITMPVIAVGSTVAPLSRLYDNGTERNAIVYTTPSSTTLTIVSTAGNLAASTDNTFLQINMFFEIQ